MFGMSKKCFKTVIGNLYKEGIIKITTVGVNYTPSIEGRQAKSKP
jgi:predicted RNA-binding protein (virulence factor B family)